MKNEFKDPKTAEGYIWVAVSCGVALGVAVFQGLLVPRGFLTPGQGLGGTLFVFIVGCIAVSVWRSLNRPE